MQTTVKLINDPKKNDLPEGHFREFFRLWVGKLEGRSMPERRDLTPLEMKYFLTHISIVDVEPDPMRFHGG